MSNLPFQNDPLLDALQSSLADVQLTMSKQRRDDLLYQSGVAAGRAESKRWLRFVGTAAMVASLAAGSLGFFAARATIETPQPPPLIAGDPPIAIEDSIEETATKLSGDIICVATPIEHLNRHFNNSDSIVDSEATPLQPILSTRSRF